MAGENDSTTLSSSVPNGPSSEKATSGGGGGQANKKNSETPSKRDKDRESSSRSSSSDSSDSSDSENSSDMDIDECDRLRDMYQVDLAALEKEFIYMRECLYREKVKHAEVTLAGIRAGTAREYLNPLQQLQENMAARIRHAQNLRDYQLISLNHKVQGEALAAQQNLESEKALLIGDIRSGLEERIHRLEEDRNNDFSSELWVDDVKQKSSKKSDPFGEKKKKPITVSGPFIVYMLNDVDIAEDWTVMKKAISAPKRGLLVL
jgi:breast cancer metastasis-suppressor 1-like protein